MTTTPSPSTPPPARRRGRARLGSVQQELQIEPRRSLVVVRPTNYERDCVTVPRPCPYVSCEQHLFLAALPALWGTLPLNPDSWTECDIEAALMALPDTCLLDVVARGDLEREFFAIANKLGISVKRAERIFSRGLKAFNQELERCNKPK